MTNSAHDYLQCATTAAVGGTLNLLAFLVSLQDIEQWLRVSSLVVGNLVGVLTVWKLTLAIRQKKVDTSKD